jgi:UDP-3-O-[3-hydroxymyristoyl] N-acetylglucosamine deacetylase/3-hydroxyacyl-[acyl-carrier-protein] dehydratase
VASPVESNGSSKQHTIEREAEFRGRGLFTGAPVTLRFKPAPPGRGITFVRADQANAVRIPARLENLTKRARRSSLKNGVVEVETVEHCLAAVRGLGIDNLDIEIDNVELPSGDGSSLAFVEALEAAKVVPQDAPRHVYDIPETIRVVDGDAELVAWPGEHGRLDIVYELDYEDHDRLPRMVYRFTLSRDGFIRDVAPARTFVFDYEAEQLRNAGLGTHLSYSDVLVIGKDGPIENSFRFPDECVRHKVLDLVGDLMLMGAPVCGRIYARRSGHSLNHELVRKLQELERMRELRAELYKPPTFDIGAIQRILPHRYPMLLVDRVLDIDGDRFARGIKNCTINEPFFTGHYPRQPIMPGVLIIEALAQLSGVLLSQKLEHTGKVAMLLSLDRVKFRRPVVPGDQLVLEATSQRVRARTGQTFCVARVGDDVAAEAMIRFMLVDADPA